MKIAILGRQNYTTNYENYVRTMPATPIPTLSPGELSSCDALILPGGGDITPAFFGERNMGSRNIDTELDILQFQALDFCLRRGIPVLGICKGMQVINVAFGGTITQDMPTSAIHRYLEDDQYHQTTILEGSCLHALYGQEMMVNSAHHQCVNRLGANLKAIQWCPADGCVEAIVHESLPVLGLQWHPERLKPAPKAMKSIPATYHAPASEITPAPSGTPTSKITPIPSGTPTSDITPIPSGAAVLRLLSSWIDASCGSSGAACPV